MNELYDKLIKVIPQDRVLKNEPMCKHTTFKIGGLADIFVIINSVQELKTVIKLAKENNININCIGNGSNILVKDEGIRGITIKLNMKEITVKDNIIEAESGASLPILAKTAYENNLSGLEFACGIPGTVGGAIYMNAGAHGVEFKDIVLSTTYLDSNIELHTIKNEEQKFSHRYSIFAETNNIIISTSIKLTKSSKEEILQKMQTYMEMRRTRQPLGMPSAGSVFKRKDNIIPAEIIDKCGLKGYNIGDAYVSEKHAGFIVNKGKAKAKDVLELIEHIKNVVKEKYNIDLELEIKVVY